MTEEAVRVRVEGRVGRITLNRPRALNALNHAMVERIAEALDAWEHDPAVTAVVVDGAGERGLCAGGDVRAIREDALRGELAAPLAFWRDEYTLNARIARYPKPYVALMDGIVMGGGVGISAHGSVRVVTERSLVAMPETGIGFVPDVGGTYLLSRAPGELGTHLALTGRPVGAGDALLCGLADHYVPSAELPALVEALAQAPAGEDAAATVARLARPAPEGELAAQRGWIDACWSAPTVEEALERLQEAGEPAAKETAEAVRGRSPIALKTTLAAVRRARALTSLEAVLDQEYRVSAHALTWPDLSEGVRSQVVDKDRAPKWVPATLDAVTDEAVAEAFVPLGEGRELGLA
ncbi:3-hydroxyisobutyryl-CoA hydrolase [Streptomyces sp. CS227]|uniref:enoyl-CoA hydratase/isomerase family protein n=1 Tax=Streptomyces sp. CS227 TaxID=1982763 RepID=UPI000B422BF7|nr:enoyl-CoA hydratase/isomerase family protein [Streptomyces sp. CS227]OWA19438.1 3-hydroxyisobutyryl-CoA hydrolase [Streptomyces sp. CS227]